MNKTLLLIVWILLGICLLAIVRFMYILPFNDGSGEPNASLFGQYGDFIGGLFGTLFAIASFLLLFESISQQKRDAAKRNEQFGEELKEQQTAFKKERFENRFFEMIKLHRDNVSEMNFTYTSKKLSRFASEDSEMRHTATHRKYFKILHEHFDSLYAETASLFHNRTEADIYISDYFKSCRSNPLFANRSINLMELAKLDLLYLILFFGVGNEGRPIIESYCRGRYQALFVQAVIDRVRLKPKEESEYWRKWKDFAVDHPKTDERNISMLIDHHRTHTRPNERSDLVFSVNYYPDRYDKFYGGHSHRLGHYFRHFYQTVKYVNELTNGSYEDKYGYVKMLRAQLSTYEQAIFFLNSLSQLGRVWEFSAPFNASAAPSINEQLITKYNLIKNISHQNLLHNINPENYYPLVMFEARDNSALIKKREELQTQYDPTQS